ncbi:hypothetical protein Catovirus_1_101 [Catovirus CTV1]|uniref:Uncharacterized protein n=1 Tax=Catovirus CTV1 TaxID=1977631 RepID=A0A1V0S8M2_9VIRU|nr:hypothetical protein Catovirus_1_101 [Catovirus CTV1]
MYVPAVSLIRLDKDHYLTHKNKKFNNEEFGYTLTNYESLGAFTKFFRDFFDNQLNIEMYVVSHRFKVELCNPRVPNLLYVYDFVPLSLFDILSIIFSV